MQGHHAVWCCALPLAFLALMALPVAQGEGQRGWLQALHTPLASNNAGTLLYNTAPLHALDPPTRMHKCASMRMRCASQGQPALCPLSPAPEHAHGHAHTTHTLLAHPLRGCGRASTPCLPACSCVRGSEHAVWGHPVLQPRQLLRKLRLHCQWPH